MCGIYGFMGKATQNTPNTLRLLGLYNIERGNDSAGMAIVNKRHHKLFKQVGNSARLFNSGVLDKIPTRGFVNIIGHTRAATTGAVTQNNAHPFKDDKLIYAHNGMISNYQELAKKLAQVVQVDTQVIGGLINKYGDDKTLENLLEGWWAIPYTKTYSPTKLKIARHTSPLSLAILPDASGVYYSSLESHLRRAIKKSGIDSPITSPSDNTIYTFLYGDELTYRVTNYQPKERKVLYSYPACYTSAYKTPYGYSVKFWEGWKDKKKGKKNRWRGGWRRIDGEWALVDR